MLLSLDEDCLRLIVELLELQDQMALANVCRHLKTIVIGVWKHDPKTVKIAREKFEYINAHKADFLEYMHSVSEHVQEIHLDGIRFMHFLDLESTTFPKVHTLWLHKELSEVDNSASIKALTKIFPNVKRLSLLGRISGEHIWNFKQVDELDLDFHDELNEKCLKTILSTLNLKKLSIVHSSKGVRPVKYLKYISTCQTLEELCLDDNQFMEFYNELSNMQRLQKLTCHIRYRFSFVWEKIVESFGNVLDKVVFCNFFSSDAACCESMRHMVTLRQLIFYNQYLEDEELSEIGAALCETLEEFYFLEEYFNNCSSFDGLLDILRQCRKLKVFDISGTDIDVSFIERVASVLALEQKKRKQTLLLRCHGTNVIEEELETLSIPDGLQISFERNELNFAEGIYLQCEWRIP